MIPRTDHENEAQLALRLAQEDHLLKTTGDATVLLAMDRLSVPSGDIRRVSRLAAGAKRFVEWYGEREKADDQDVVEGTRLLRRDFSRYIGVIKKKSTPPTTVTSE
jgi:hypothetical protein